MLRWVVALGFIAVASSAFGADFEPPIFGTPYVAAPPLYTRWAGLFVGGQAGFARTVIDFSGVSAIGPSDPFLAPYGKASVWARFSEDDPNAAAFGGFVGYNLQWDSVIIGVEANYNRTSLQGSSSGSRCYLADPRN